jgi:steroid delta-isomerase-like uncharacterized protein
MEPREVIEQYIADVLNDDVPGAAEALISDESFRLRVVRLREAFPDLEVTPDVLLAEGDLVAAHFTARGTHHGLFNGVPPTGNEWEARCTAIYRVEDGRIAEAWVTWDLLSLMEQLDAVERVQTVSA